MLFSWIMKTTREEIADIIFNSKDSRLNDLLMVAIKSKVSPSDLISKMALDINSSSSHQLANLAIGSVERRYYIAKELADEMNLYCKIIA